MLKPTNDLDAKLTKDEISKIIDKWEQVDSDGIEEILIDTAQSQITKLEKLGYRKECQHLHKWHNPEYADSEMKCLDCGEENV